MTTPESLPPLMTCPFCGRAPELMERPDNAAETAFIAAVVCYCGGYASCAHKMVTSNTQAEATRAVTAEWNQRAALSSRQVQPEHPMACWSVDVHDDDDGRTWINIRNPDDDVACLSAKTMIRRGQRSIAASVLYEFHAAWTAMHEQPAQAEACCPVGQICSRCAAGISSLMDGRSAQAEAVEPVGEAGTMPGTSGFTMACFHADKVPVGTKLYTQAPTAVPEVEDGWFPIDSAPKDGTSVQLCWARDADGNPIDWTRDLKTAQVFVQVASWWSDSDGWVVYCDQISEPRLHFTPTHWRPLPPPPIDAALSAEKEPTK